MCARPSGSFQIGSAFYAVPNGQRLIIYRRADDTWAGETEISKGAANELRRLADALDGGRLL